MGGRRKVRKWRKDERERREWKLVEGRGKRRERNEIEKEGERSGGNDRGRERNDGSGR